MLSRSDVILILSLLLIALLFIAVRKYYSSKGGAVCHVTYERKVVMTVPLDKDRIFSVEKLPNVVIEVRDGRIAFTHSDCPDQICVRTGFIGEHGQFAACLPNRIALRISKEGGENTPDTVVQ